MKRNNDTPMEHSVVYVCQECKAEFGPGPSSREHLNAAHGHAFEPNTLMVHGVEFLDGEGYYINRFEIFAGDDAETVYGYRLDGGPREMR